MKSSIRTSRPVILSGTAQHWQLAIRGDGTARKQLLRSIMPQSS
jgi:hypothetical protein